METRELDAIASREIQARGAKSSFKGYRGASGAPQFPATVCVSVNEEIVHGIPGKRVLKEGDLLKLDFGVIYKGFHGDSAISFTVGEPSEQQKSLMEATEGSLYAGIEQARVGARMGDVSAAIQRFVEDRGFSIVREYVGHGIGRSLHEEPQVPNYGEPGKGPVLKKGMCLAIEPMVNVGTWETEVMPDKWTVKTKDRKLSAHFEHTIAITEAGPEILTLAPSANGAH
jgi:methionyl aminopeptidase